MEVVKLSISFIFITQRIFQEYFTFVLNNQCYNSRLIKTFQIRGIELNRAILAVPT